MRPYFIILSFLLLGSFSLYAQCEKNNNPNIHVVKEKETLYSIAQEYDITVKEICELNDITATTTIHICQELKLPVPYKFDIKNAEVESLDNRLPYHEVQKGETIAQLAKKYGYTEEKFRDFNHLPESIEVQAGTRLRTSNCEIETQEDAPPKAMPKAIKPVTQAPEVISVPRVREHTDNEEDKGAAMLEEINLLRSNPIAYIPYILEHQANFVERGKSSDKLNETIEELIDILKVQDPLPLLQFSPCAYDVAQAKAAEIQRTATTNHLDSAGATPWERLKSKCVGCKDGAENFAWGAKSVRDLVIVLLIDNGTENKRHRNALLNPRWTHAACYPIGNFNTPTQLMKNLWIQEFIEQK